MYIAERNLYTSLHIGIDFGQTIFKSLIKSAPKRGVGLNEKIIMKIHLCVW